MEKLIIGRKDHADLPLFGLVNVPVKIDTGAYSSSIHCDKIDLIEAGGKEFLKVEFFAANGLPATVVTFETFKTKKVRSSSGQEENRYFVYGNIVLFSKKYKALFSLTKRKRMRYPILLGRKLLNKRFIVDPSKIDLSLNNLKSTVFIN
ncbi:MAG: RimK/LysX family protein [Crocinitomicaceae bacterium]